MPSVVSPCCPSGSLPAAKSLENQSQLKGETIEISGDNGAKMEMYHTGASLETAKHITIIFSDVWGFKSGRHRSFADDLSSELNKNETAVVIPDLYHGKPVMEPVWLPFGFEGGIISRGLGFLRSAWRMAVTFRARGLITDLKYLVVKYLKKQNASVSFSCVGFCYGGWLVGRVLEETTKFLSMPSSEHNEDSHQSDEVDSPLKFECGVGIHPAFEVEPFFYARSVDSLAHGIGQVPILLLPAKNDIERIKAPDGSAVKILAAARKVEVGKVSFVFKDMFHGWVTREESKDNVREEQGRALTLTANFIKEHVKRKND